MILITGGGTGIGRALALALAHRGKSVFIVGRRESLLQETANHSPLIQYLCADVSTDDGMQSIIKQFESTANISALIHNAASIEPIVTLNQIEPAAWQKALRTNLDAPLFLTQALYSQLSGGRVLNIGSGAAYFPVKGWGAYCVTKAALSMLTRCWNLESQSVAFASVMPGIIDTDMQALIRHSQNMDPEQVDFYKRLKQSDRLVTADTVAEFLAWILMDVDAQTYSAKEWDIYDTTHHSKWLKAPYQVPHWDM